MNADRELLELAAKAVGYTTAHKWNSERMRFDPPVIALVVHKDSELVSTGWDPLNDDGDALRLAVKLRIRIAGMDKRACAFMGLQEFWEPEGNDPYAATRRAIVRSAAEIGKAMP